MKNLPEYLLVAMLLTIVGVVVAASLYEYRHPCLRYSTHRVFVPEVTIQVTTGQVQIGDMTIPITTPMTTPAHYEDEQVCEARK